MRKHVVTQEFRVVYFSDGQFDPANYTRLCYLFRDFETDDLCQVNPRLFNLLFALQRGARLATGQLLPIQLLSGFRTPQHNSEIEGAAPNSQHTYGNASDIRIPTIAPREVAKGARACGMGGVGIYSTFTHVDVGRVRQFIGHSHRS